ncbi:Hydrogen:quinone oxidoreductase quinone-reactive Ni/Fe-hydrogenase HupV [Vitreoscilla filiformis]|jgi:hydrogenase large subunit|uniref:Hydrogen:quinone oxidoreductase quinone-reactive Ni/Fe-hydrogenase HupV n=1 Tax=Vitreoscilla filiformis TaxID=63 RepID=A0A221KH56_VITFI|nr:nickel-dependent hydrogenase large subunit [Vitreoscilla filiformis]ASM78163.1 Hydrogen:quinone oxidoreductase quinone-reactive Ni/Fe-hydrogenase HupV [Vitreoscilla filiformis]
MSNTPTGRLLVGPFNRVEGDLEVQLQVADGRVASAQVNATMYRGFEQLLPGRAVRDALVVVPRICGICSVSQSVAAARALADAAGVTPPPNGQHALNLMQACENLADHLSHFYLFFAPDFTRPIYADRPWWPEAVRRWAALGAGVTQGEHARQALAARQRWFTLMGTLGGKWPHTQSVQPGGSSRAIDAAERLRLMSKLREMRAFLESTLFAAPLEDIAALRDAAALARWHAADPLRGDLRFFLTVADDLALAQLGAGPGRTLSWGAYPQPDAGLALAAGVCEHPSASPLTRQAPDVRLVTEDATHAWLADSGGPRHPAQGVTLPDVDKPAAYSWNKAPRLDGRVVETGAIARQLADGQPLITDVVQCHGSQVVSRVLARLIELARVLPMMERWLGAIVPREPFYTPDSLPDEGEGMGLTEAARGALGHWVRWRNGRLLHYQIVAPTSWNFSPRDAQGQPGALEAALVGAPVYPGERTPVAVQHIVRSFDPCMVCTVH